MGLFSRKKKTDEAEKAAPAVKTEARPKTEKKSAEKKVSMKDLYGSQSAPAKSVAPAKEGAATAVTAESKLASRAYRVLIKPLVTEKAANLGAQNKYVFAVAETANKIEVAEAVAMVYGIKPLSVNIVRVKGKQVRYGRIRGERKDWKKAIVMLPAGKTINIYEGV